jgi:Na+-driven multidrug efflux pump
VCGAVACFLNGIEIVRPQVVMAIISLMGNISISIYLINRYGVEGAVWGSVISYLIFVLLPYYFLTQKIIKDFNLINIKPIK